jgi:hypothetical protein
MSRLNEHVIPSLISSHYQSTFNFVRPRYSKVASCARDCGTNVTIRHERRRPHLNAAFFGSEYLARDRHRAGRALLASPVRTRREYRVASIRTFSGAQSRLHLGLFSYLNFTLSLRICQFQVNSRSLSLLLREADVRVFACVSSIITAPTWRRARADKGADNRRWMRKRRAAPATRSPSGGLEIRAATNCAHTRGQPG